MAFDHTILRKEGLDFLAHFGDVVALLPTETDETQIAKQNTE